MRSLSWTLMQIKKYSISIWRKCYESWIRLLTKTPSNTLKTLVGKFLARPGATIEARSSNVIHDRVIFIDCKECWVIGQSIKDAAMKKPTYLLPVAAVSDMQRLYEDTWSNATPYG